MKYWEIIADNLSKAGSSWGCVSAVASQGRTIWIADAHRGDGRRFIVHADEKLSAFVELERQVLTVTFHLESIRADASRMSGDKGTQLAQGRDAAKEALKNDQAL